MIEVFDKLTVALIAVVEILGLLYVGSCCYLEWRAIKRKKKSAA